MTEADIEAVRRIYGFDWASVTGRREGFAKLAGFIAPEFESRFTPELGSRVARGVAQLSVFGEAIEQDFSEFRYVPDDFTPVGGDRVVVSGQIVCTARASGIPLGGAFSHVWTLRDGSAVLVDAYRDRDQAARAAAGA